MSVQTDKEFAHGHARRFCEGSPSWGSGATEYADWYIARYWSNEGGLEALPDHSRAWNTWLTETERV